jgi:SAM-dependent methyltransferase
MSHVTGEVRYSAAFYDQLYTHEAGNFWFRGRNRVILWALARFVGAGSARYLEIGCGTGFVLSAVERAFPAWAVTGSEVLEEGLAFARTRVARADLRALDALALPYTAAFDVVGAYDVIEHIVDDEAVLAEVHRAIAPGGWLALTVPQHPFMWSEADAYAGHVRRYTRDELTGKLARAGFEVRLATGFVSLLFPLMAARRLGRKTPATYDPEAEFRLPRWLNGAFSVVMAVEHAMLRAGMRFPFGGSLLVVARRPGEQGSSR